MSQSSLHFCDLSTMGRILYNVTVKVDDEIETAWLDWMQQTHIPEVMDTGCFEGYRIHRLKYPVEDEGVTYAIQYACSDMPTLEKYHSHFASALQKDHHQRFGNRTAAFRTILEEICQSEQD